MEQKPTPQTPFDHQVCPRHLQFMKLLLPYISTSSQSMLGIFIKFQELQHTIRFFQSPRASMQIQSSHTGDISIKQIAEEFLPYLDPKQSDMIHSIVNAMEMMEVFQNFTSSEDSLKNMLSPEQKEMFDFYSSMFSQDMDPAYANTETAKKEEPAYGSMDESSGFKKS